MISNASYQFDDPDRFLQKVMARCGEKLTANHSEDFGIAVNVKYPVHIQWR
jgi:hypothetical protein